MSETEQPKASQKLRAMMEADKPMDAPRPNPEPEYEAATPELPPPVQRYNRLSDEASLAIAGRRAPLPMEQQVVFTVSVPKSLYEAMMHHIAREGGSKRSILLRAMKREGWAISDLELLDRRGRTR